MSADERTHDDGVSEIWRVVREELSALRGGNVHNRTQNLICAASTSSNTNLPVDVDQDVGQMCDG